MSRIVKNLAIEYFIVSYLIEHDSVDCMSEEFHEEFTRFFGGEVNSKNWGPQSNKLAMSRLKNLYDQGILLRNRIGIEGGGVGFPKWIYVYSLNPRYKKMYEA